MFQSIAEQRDLYGCLVSVPRDTYLKCKLLFYLAMIIICVQYNIFNVLVTVRTSNISALKLFHGASYVLCNVPATARTFNVILPWRTVHSLQCSSYSRNIQFIYSKILLVHCRTLTCSISSADLNAHHREDQEIQEAQEAKE